MHINENVCIFKELAFSLSSFPSYCCCCWINVYHDHHTGCKKFCVLVFDPRHFCITKGKKGPLQFLPLDKLWDWYAIFYNTIALVSPTVISTILWHPRYYCSTILESTSTSKLNVIKLLLDCLVLCHLHYLFSSYIKIQCSSRI